MSKISRSQRRKNRPAQIKKKKSPTLRDIYNAAPSMLHEKLYIALDCVLCNATMKSIHDTHDARPLAPSQTAKQAFEKKKNIGRCCSVCNAKHVLPARYAIRYAA